jgi:hypothetical protein
MSMDFVFDPISQLTIRDRAAALFAKARDARFKRVDRLFCGLMVAQWAFAIGVAVLFSPYGWAGKVKTVHFHVYIALIGGAALTVFPLLLAKLRPGAPVTRHVMAISQMLWSALLIHLSGGRIETHFHVFGSLAFLAFYLDWRVLITATVVVAGDHFMRGVFWPESVYGIVNPEWWRFLEHAFWVVFEDIVLVWSCIIGVAEMKGAALANAERQAAVELITQSEQQKSAALDMVMAELGGVGA